MRKVHIFNPAAGKQRTIPYIEYEETYTTKCSGDAEVYAYNTCLSENVHFIVHGGDGTISEVANGIIKANAGNRTLLSVVPEGTGNDFIKTFEQNSEIKYVDAIKFNDRYCINSLNTGLDLVVVECSNKYKKLPFVSGSFAYLLGVLDILFKKKSEKWNISIITDDNKSEVFYNQEFSLALFANGKFYGGGFNAAPMASANDGLIDMILIKKVSTLTLLKLLLSYRAGNHFCGNGVSKKFEKYMIYRKCTNVKINNIKKICSDGEIYSAESADISIAKNVLRYI